MINIHEIAAALHAKKTGAGWIAKCPAHEDKTPSLAMREKDGRILLRCHAGCAQADVIAALRDRGLWPKLGRPSRPARPDADFAGDTIRAGYWKRSAGVLTEWLLEKLDPADPERMAFTYLVNVLGKGEATVLAEYRAWKQCEPGLTAALVHAGQLSDARLQRRLAEWIQGGMHANHW